MHVRGGGGRLRPGDRIRFDLPYARATYSFTRRAVIPETQTSILHGPRRDELRLQASTIPPGHRRVIAFARVLSVERR